MFMQKPSSATLFLGALLATVSSARGMAETAPAPAQAPATYDVVRLGDGQMPCAELAGEINQLTREVTADRAAAQTQAEQTARSAQVSAENASLARRMAMGGLVHASAFIPFGGGFAAMAARSAAMNAASAAAVAPQAAAPIVIAAAPVETLRSQRLALLQGLFGRKAC